MSAYDRFVTNNTVIAAAYDECLNSDIETDDGQVDGDVYDRAINRMVKDQFNKMAAKIKELEAPRVDPCPHCQCSELLCGHPNNCSSEG